MTIFSVFLLTLVTPTAAANGTTTVSAGVPTIQVDTSAVAAAAVWTDTTIPVERETTGETMARQISPTSRATTPTRASFFVTGAVPCEGATTFQNEMPATSMPRDTITDTSDAGSPPAFPRTVDTINDAASPAGEGCDGGNVMKQQAGKVIAPLLVEGCDDGNAMQPSTAPIMSDALDIIPLYSRMVCEKVTTAAAKNVQFSQENQQQEGRSRFLQVLLLAMAAVNDAIAGAGPPPRLDVLLATVAAAAVAWHIFRGKRPPQENLQTQVSEVQDAVRGCCTSWFPSIITQCRGLLGCTDDSTQKSLVRTKPEVWLRWLDDAYSRRYSKQTRKGRKSIHPPRTTGAGPLVLLCAMAGVVLRLDAVGAVPLTKALYAEIASGAKESKIVTSIPAREFQNFEGDVTLGEMPLLQSIGNHAFSQVKGVLKFEVGDSCTKLSTIGDSAFQNIDTAASVITIGELPALASIGTQAFVSFKGLLKFEVGDSCSKLATIGFSAFSFLSNADSVIAIGELPALTSIGSAAFREFQGLFKFEVAESCSKLAIIDDVAFDSGATSNADSVITIGALPALASIGALAFSGFKGVLKFEVGDSCTKLANIGNNAFSSISNADSVMTIGELPELTSLESFAFSSFKGVLKFEVGDSCSKLGTIGSNAFIHINNADTVITIGALPGIMSIAAGAFQNMAGLLSLTAGDCPKLREIGRSAFLAVANSASTVSFGTLPALTKIGIEAFKSMNGELTINAGNCPNLHTIDESAFTGCSNSKSLVSFANMQLLAKIGKNAFLNYKGTLILDGNAKPSFPKLTADNAVDDTAFDGASNTASVIYLYSKDSVPKLEDVLAKQGSTFGGTIEYGEIVGCGASDDDVPLTKELYEEMKGLSEDAKAKKEEEITCVAAYEFANFASDVTLGALPNLVTIDGSAFRGFEETLTIGKMPALTLISRNAFTAASKLAIEAGDCKKLHTIESFAFSNAGGSVTFGATPALKSIERQAFEGFNGVLIIKFGDMKTLPEISLGAFSSISSTSSAVSIGALPALKLVADSAFLGFAGTLTIAAKECPKLTTIEASAFESVSNLNSSIAFGATSALTSIGTSAFKAMKGKLTFAAGDVPVLTKFESSSFAAVTNSKSSITFTNLKLLESIEASAFSAFTGTITISGTPDYSKLIAVHATAFDGTSNTASIAILPQEGKTPLLKDALSGRFGGTIIHRADPGSPCDQTTSAGTWGECTADRSSACKFHCCSLDVDSACLSCGSDGGCYDLAFTPTDAAKAQRDSWPESMLELQKSTLPVDEMINVNSTIKRGAIATAITVQYKLQWSTDDEKSSDDDINGPPPRTGLVDSGKGSDPGSVTIDAKTGVVTYNPDRAGTYTMWLIAYEVDEKGIEVHNQPDVPPEFDQVVLARWTFEVKPIPTFATNSATWNPKDNSITKAMQPEYLLNEAHSFPAPSIPNKDLFVNALDNDLNADFDSITFKLKVSSSPGKLLVDTETGEMLMLPEKIDTGYTLSLLAVDKRGSVAIVVDAFEFSVVEPPAFKIGVDETGPRREVGDKFDDYDIITKYVTGESYRIAPRQLIESETTVSSGEFKNIKYALEGAPDGWFVGTDNGQITGVFDEPTEVSKPITMTLNAVDE
eukprot:gene14775-28688_t